MHRLLICTGNHGKMVELKELLPPNIDLLSLHDARLSTDLPETGHTLHENALQKARFAHSATGMSCLADDTGLEVYALNGAPGVHSARYAGEAKDPQANMAKLLRELEERADRGARFRTVLALVDGDGERTFEGEVQGVITARAIGTGGFGYDPIFLPKGSTLTFAQMDRGAKNALSHRGLAMRKFLDHLAR